VNPIDRERVKDLLARAACLEPAKRRAFIESEAGGNAEIAAEALELLHTLDDSVFMSAPTGAGFAETPALAGSLCEGPGAKIGRYKLLQLVGEGGFGSVFMAEQTEPVHRRVALKIIKAGMDTKQVIARFDAERQALALMDHPNIARVLDAGATDGGRPYFVMELVRGEAVTRYCDQERVTVRQRIELFRDVCGALQHAHQKGIIHRDLKPSNVLVTVADGKPLPKVIDFGIAKATAGRLTDKTLFTELHQLIGTPEYMSPEQAEVSGVDIDTRSDVYALGVLLYELLAGSTPLERGRLRSTPLAEIQRLIREEEPPRPSLRLATLASSPGARRSRTAPDSASESSDSSAIEIARRRRSDPLLLTRTLRGDLDWIVLKCLEKDRTRRYATASALADDVGRYLMDQPVLATPPSTGYKLRKFVRRNRTAVLAGATIAAVLVLGIIGTTLGLVWAVRAERTAVVRLEESQRSAAKATAVSSFLREMLSSVDPAKALGQEVTIRQALDQAAAKIESGSLKDQAEIEADLRSTIGMTYLALGHYAQAEPHLRSSLDIRKRLHGETHPSVAEALDNLSVLFRSQGRYAEGESLAREELAILRRLHGDEHPDVASAMQSLAAALRAQHKYDEAEPYYRQALAVRRRLLGEEDIEVAQSVNNLALLLQNKGEYASAEPLFREALAMRRRLLGDEHPVVAGAVNNLANLLLAQGEVAEAGSLLREALEVRRKLLGPDHPDVAQSLNNLAVVYSENGDYAAAEPLYRQALEIWRKRLPEGHPDIGRGVAGVGVSLLARNAYAEAEPFLRESLAIREASLPEGHWQRFVAMSEVGASLAGQGRFGEAEVLLIDGYLGLRGQAQVSEKLKSLALARIIKLYDAWNQPELAAQWRAELEKWQADSTQPKEKK